MVSMMEVDWQAVLLDLLNTTPVVGDRIQDRLDGHWLRAHGGSDENLAVVRRLRDDLQRVVRGEADASMLNGYLTGAHQLPRIDADGLEWSLEAGWAARVVLAWGELANEMPGRLRACANDECRLFLLDRTRAGTARWCSMSACGNRMKARRHYTRSARGAQA